MATAWDADGVVGRISTLLDRARTEGVPVVYVQHEEDHPESDMQRGSEGWQIVDAIAPREGEPVVAKTFPDSFEETELKSVLDGLGVRHVVMAGAQTDVCIRNTSARTVIEGYDLTLVEDCHTTEDSMFDMTDGEKVELPAKQLVAHQNLCTLSTRYPGRVATIAPHQDVTFVR
jgi:nicotinamidase-related amidase